MQTYTIVYLPFSLLILHNYSSLDIQAQVLIQAQIQKDEEEKKKA
jgi:hypothetical protein